MCMVMAWGDGNSKKLMYIATVVGALCLSTMSCVLDSMNTISMPYKMYIHAASRVPANTLFLSMFNK